MGPTALEQALVASLAPNGIGKLPYGQFSMNGLVGWVALRATREVPPNTAPWEHLGDLAELKQQLGAALNV